jgi:hypothetical protein
MTARDIISRIGRHYLTVSRDDWLSIQCAADRSAETGQPAELTVKVRVEAPRDRDVPAKPPAGIAAVDS